jgi:SAM-dependent methyltransferase
LSLEKWNERYQAGEQILDTPTPLVEKFAGVPAGDALDVACGPGRHALYLASLGWHVTAVDGSNVALNLLREHARQRKLVIDSRLADLERGEFEIPESAYDLICDCYYLQRDLIPAIQRGLRPGGTAIVIVHLIDADHPEPTQTRALPGELRKFFDGWSILHYYEGPPNETGHRHPVAELAARKPPAQLN